MAEKRQKLIKNNETKPLKRCVDNASNLDRLEKSLTHHIKKHHPDIELQENQVYGALKYLKLENKSHNNRANDRYTHKKLNIAHKLFRCKYCKKILVKKECYNHLNRIHNIKNVPIQDHVIGFYVTESFINTKDGETFLIKKNKKSKTKTLIPLKPNQCRYCRMVFDSKQTLWLHQKDYHLHKLPQTLQVRALNQDYNSKFRKKRLNSYDHAKMYGFSGTLTSPLETNKRKH